MNEEKLIIHNKNGIDTIVEDPFAPMKAVYDALKDDPNAIPELSDESRAYILAQITKDNAPKRKAEPEPEPATEPARIYKPNRHQRRRAAALNRKKGN